MKNCKITIFFKKNCNYEKNMYFCATKEFKIQCYFLSKIICSLARASMFWDLIAQVADFNAVLLPCLRADCGKV